MSIRVAALSLWLIAAAVPAVAHHSLASQFDEDKPITLTGVVSKVEWYNPHVYLYLDVTDASGTVRTWAVESFPPATLRRGGLTRDKLGLGQKVTMLAYHARNGKDLAFLRKITFDDGKEIVIWLGDVKQAGNK